MPAHDPWDHNPEAAFLLRDSDIHPGAGGPPEDASIPRDHGLPHDHGPGKSTPGVIDPGITDPEDPSPEDAFHPREHDHGHCIADALLKAEAICTIRGARLTRIRRSVLEFVWESHSPVGAYDILDRMNADGPLPGGGPRSAPITVYRALEFLMAQGLVHRLASMNAYTGCGLPGTPHGAHFLICDDCGAAAELHDTDIERAISRGAARAGFAIKSPVVEVQGRCPACRPFQDEAE